MASFQGMPFCAHITSCYKAISFEVAFFMMKSHLTLYLNHLFKQGRKHCIRFFIVAF